MMIKVLKMIYSVIQWTVIGLAVLIVGLYVFGIRPYIVQTGSMEPTVPTGCVCFVNQRARFSDMAEGDVIAFVTGEMMVTHRAVRITDEGIITKGDANNTEDAAPVTAETFVGKTILWIPRVGIAVTALKNRWGIAVFLTGAALFLLLGRLLDKAAPQHTQGDDRS